MDITHTSDSPLDSWTLADSCRLLAQALVNPQNKNSRFDLAMLMQKQLENLEIALMLPVPEHRKNMGIPVEDGLFDYTELEPAELCEQCLALNYALLTMHDKKIKEIMSFILWERLDMLRLSLYASSEVIA